MMTVLRTAVQSGSVEFKGDQMIMLIVAGCGENSQLR